MTASQKYKAKIKERIRLSNEAVANGLHPDPWVIEYREKKNKQKAGRKAKQPVKPRVPRTANKQSFKKGVIPHNKLPKDVKQARYNAYQRKYRAENRQKLNAALREKRRENPQFRIACNLRKRLSWLVRQHNTAKTSQTLALLGCSMEYFMQYLSTQFQEGMTFENYGKWHIDHKTPCNLFDLTNPEQQAHCFHYTNLQPLWALDNIRKSDKIVTEFARKLISSQRDIDPEIAKIVNARFWDMI